MSQAWPSTTQGTGNNLPPPNKTKAVRLKLNTSRDCQKALARLIRAAMAGTVHTQDLSRYANALSILSRLIEGSDIEARLEALEGRSIK